MTATGGQSAGVIEEIRLAVEVDDGRPVGLTVAGQLVQDSLELPRPIDSTAHRVRDLLRRAIPVSQVVPASSLVQVRALLKARHVDDVDAFLELAHAAFESRV